MRAKVWSGQRFPQWITSHIDVRHKSCCFCKSACGRSHGHYFSWTQRGSYAGSWHPLPALKPAEKALNFTWETVIKPSWVTSWHCLILKGHKWRRSAAPVQFQTAKAKRVSESFCLIFVFSAHKVCCFWLKMLLSSVTTVLFILCYVFRWVVIYFCTCALVTWRWDLSAAGLKRTERTKEPGAIKS